MSSGVSDAIARHIEHAGLFDSVVYPEGAERADCKLTGKIYDYNAMGKVRPKADKKPVYKEADSRLKEVVTEMIEEIGEAHEKSAARWKRSPRSRIK